MGFLLPKIERHATKSGRCHHEQGAEQKDQRARQQQAPFAQPITQPAIEGHQRHKGEGIAQRRPGSGVGIERKAGAQGRQRHAKHLLTIDRWVGNGPQLTSL
jgi:hypothetical protein